MWVAPGSGIWYNVGRSLDARGPTKFTQLWKSLPDRPCTVAHQRGYDSIQLSAWDSRFTFELLDCRGATQLDANRSWHSACPPAHVALLNGAPPRHRYAPALEHLHFEELPRSCTCDDSFDFLNCAGSSSNISATAKPAASEQGATRDPAATLEQPQARRHSYRSSSLRHPPAQADAQASDGSSRFRSLLTTRGAFVVAFDSWQLGLDETLHESDANMSNPGRNLSEMHSFAKSKLRKAICWAHPGQGKRFSARVLSASFVSDRVPNTFCAQPMRDSRNCGTYDLLLLFEASRELWKASCYRSLGDTCGYIPKQCVPLDTLDEKSPPGCLINASVCSKYDRARAAGRCQVRGPEHLEAAMLNFQRTCFQSSSAAGGAALRPEEVETCDRIDTRFRPDFVNRGILNNEVQFPCSDAMLTAFASALVGVGVITVKGGKGRAGEAASGVRRLKAQLARSTLTRKLPTLTQPLELWEHTLDAHDGPPNGLRHVPWSIRERQTSVGNVRYPELAPSFGGATVPLAPSWGYNKVGNHGQNWWLL